MAVTGPFDVVVVGAGAGGAAVAWRLCTKGLRVLILEAGPRFNSERDYPLTDPGWERRGFPVRPGSAGAVRFGDLGVLDPEDRDLASWNRVSGPLVRGARRVPAGQGYAHVQGVGGSTLHFVGEAHRLNPRAMRLRSAFGAGADWPLNFAALEPYYTLCETLIGVAGAPGDARWADAAHLQPPHPLSPSSARLVEAGRSLGMTWQSNCRAALSQPLDGRPPCNYCGNCARGCPLGDKGSADVTFVRKAEATGRLQIETGAQVTQIATDRTGRVRSVSFVQDGRATRLETPVLVLAAGAVQTPRLLLASGGLGNGSGQVGRNFMETLHWASTGLAPDLANSHMGLPADAICWDFNTPGAVPGAVGGCRFSSAAQEQWLVGPIAYGTRLIPGFGAALKRDLRTHFGTAISVGAIGETLPDESCFVDLDPDNADESGMPLPRINATLTDNSLRLLHFMAAKSRELLGAAGVEMLAEEGGAWDRFHATHVFGTCRMGADSATSVVDAHGRAHDVPNLYIADASVFPSSGGGEAPALTIQSLAIRTADRILA